MSTVALDCKKNPNAAITIPIFTAVVYGVTSAMPHPTPRKSIRSKTRAENTDETTCASSASFFDISRVSSGCKPKSANMENTYRKANTVLYAPNPSLPIVRVISPIEMMPSAPATNLPPKEMRKFCAIFFFSVLTIVCVRFFSVPISVSAE